MLGEVLQGLWGLHSVQLRWDELLLLGGGGRCDLLLAALFFLQGRECRGPAGQDTSLGTQGMQFGFLIMRYNLCRVSAKMHHLNLIRSLSTLSLDKET